MLSVATMYNFITYSNGIAFRCNDHHLELT